MAQGQIWWGKFDVVLGETRRWRIGPSNVWVSRGDGEWRVAREVVEDSLENQVEAAVEDHEPVRDDIEVSRFATQSTSTKLRLMPALADRPVIVKSDKPFYVPKGEVITLYISVPVWLRVIAGDRKDDLLDTPIVRPSDTWFGPNTLSGQLCYATRTTARVRLANLPARPHRAITSALVRNHADSMLHLRRLKIPVENLSLFTTRDGALWTESLTLDREGDTEAAQVSLEKQPRDVAILKRLTGPRHPASKGFLIDAFGGLFTRRGDKKDERVPARAGGLSDPDV